MEFGCKKDYHFEEQRGEAGLRASIAGRWIVGLLLICPLLIIQLIHFILVMNGEAAAQHYLLGSYTGLVDWTSAPPIAGTTRAAAMLILLSAFAAMVFGIGKSAFTESSRNMVAIGVFVGWLFLLLV